ncbi:MAG: carbohydrate ABC transporter permease [Anaerolineales bacterium]|nr:carbohydrate ABC transporter permease [Anaerolineales bacterium]
MKNNNNHLLSKDQGRKKTGSSSISVFLRKNGEQTLVIAFLIVMSIPFIFPFWWMFTSSFKNMNEILGTLSLFPDTFRLENFIDIFTFQPFARQYFNSTYIALLVTLGIMVLSSFAGYGFARIQFPGNSALFILLLSAMMMPIEVTIIPNFFIFKAFGLTNSHLPLIILPILGSSGVFGVFMMRQFFLSIPKELEEAGMLDGLNRLGIFWHIVLPMSKSALAAVAILTFLFNWNVFLEPLVFINDIDLFTLPVALQNYTSPYDGTPVWNLQFAASTLSVIPVLLIYLMAQRQVQNNMALSGMK